MTDLRDGSARFFIPFFFFFFTMVLPFHIVSSLSSVSHSDVFDGNRSWQSEEYHVCNFNSSSFLESKK